MKSIYESLPKNALLIVVAHGDINDAKGYVHKSTLLIARIHEAKARTKEEWTKEEEAKLEEVVEKIRQGITFVKIKE